MRPIKFRAWDTVKNRMYYVGEESDVTFSFDSYGIVAVDIAESEDEFKTLHHLKYSQFTGLHDKNGVEIYEGDIVNGLANFDNEFYVRTVVWKDCGLTLNPGTGYTLCKNNEHCFEVIGNKYEGVRGEEEV